MAKPTWKPAEVQQSLIPYVLLGGDANAFIAFLKDAFGAEERMRHPREDGTVMHAELVIDDTSFMLADSPTGTTVHPFRHYFYVPDVDETYARAIRSGAIPGTAPADQPYGDRVAEVKDPWGNTWWLGTHMQQHDASG